MTDLKPRTRYHCPVSVAGDGYGHSSLYTGDYSSPRDRDGVCICGAQMVETIAQGLHVLTWEMIGPYDDDWRPVRREHRVAHEAQQQAFGLKALADRGEQVRNIRLVSYDPCADAPTDNQGDTPMISPTPEHDKALSFHPLTPGRGEVHELLRSAAKVLAAVYDNHLPPSREASLAFTAVQESLMWANAAVAIHTPPPGISGTDD